MAQDQEKELAAKAAVALIEDGMIVGLGSGSTSLIAVRLLAERVKAGLKIQGIPTSEETGELAEKLGIPLVTLDEVRQLDIDIDGADEVDPSLCLIKGGGGKLLREKIVAFASKKLIIMVDSSKLVKKLGKFKLPIEVIPFARSVVEANLQDIGAKPVLRKNQDGSTYLTDEKNWILDCDFGLIEDPRDLSAKLANIPGIVEHGLFVDMTECVLVGEEGDVREIRR